MFGQMMSSIDDEYVKYVMHSQVQVMPRPALDPGLAGAQYLAPEGPVLGAQAIAGALAAGPAPGEEVVFASAEEAGVGANGGAPAPRSVAAAAPVAASSAVQTSSQGSEFDRVGRNDPCPCGSGKKFKFCHGR
jgi:preprotein translocase subunit SecA